MTIIPVLFFLRAIYHYIGSGIEEVKILFLALLPFPLLISILPVKYIYTMTIIEIVAPLVTIFVAGHVRY